MVAGVADPTVRALANAPDSPPGKRARTRSEAGKEREPQDHDAIQRTGAEPGVEPDTSSLLDGRSVGPHLRRRTRRGECRQASASVRDARIDGAWRTRLRAGNGACLA